MRPTNSYCKCSNFKREREKKTILFRFIAFQFIHFIYLIIEERENIENIKKQNVFFLIFMYVSNSIYLNCILYSLHSFWAIHFRCLYFFFEYVCYSLSVALFFMCYRLMLIFTLANIYL